MGWQAHNKRKNRQIGAENSKPCWTILKLQSPGRFLHKMSVFIFPLLLRFPPAWPASLRNHGVLRDRSCGREARRSLKSFDFQPWGRRIRPRDCVFGTATKSYRGGWNARPHGWLADLLRGRLKMALPNMLVLQSKAMTIFQSEPLAESGPAANIQKPFWAVPTQTQY